MISPLLAFCAVLFLGITLLDVLMNGLKGASWVAGTLLIAGACVAGAELLR